MPEILIMRGKTPSGQNEKLNFGGHTPGFAYRLIEFDIYPSLGIGANHYELTASLTAAKTYEDPVNPNFKNPGLIATALLVSQSGIEFYGGTKVVNDQFYITQDLIIAVNDSVAGAPMDVNWQCKFEKVKLSSSAEAVANFNQFTIYDE